MTGRRIAENGLGERISRIGPHAGGANNLLNPLPKSGNGALPEQQAWFEDGCDCSENPFAESTQTKLKFVGVYSLDETLRRCKQHFGLARPGSEEPPREHIGKLALRIVLFDLA